MGLLGKENENTSHCYPRNITGYSRVTCQASGTAVTLPFDFLQLYFIDYVGRKFQVLLDLQRNRVTSADLMFDAQEYGNKQFPFSVYHPTMFFPFTKRTGHIRCHISQCFEPFI